MDNNWIHEQISINIAQFDKAMEAHYPESKVYIYDPLAHISRIGEYCNYLDAVKLIDWSRYLAPNSSVLDMGCGGGWLTAYLSRFESIKTIYALDSSRHYLLELMPKVVELMHGRAEKVVSIQGFFTPLLTGDGTFDIVVAASALHHADNLECVLKEIRRTLKKDGLLFILNEVPFSWGGYITWVAASTLRIFTRLVLRMYKPISQSVSASGFLDNPILGDRIYPLWYWKEAIKRAGFSIEEYINTGLPTVKKAKDLSLKHFVCRAV